MCSKRTFLISLAYVAHLILIQDVFAFLPAKMKHFFYNKPSKKTTKNCSIHKSAIVRQILLTDFFPVFEKYAVEVPRKCKFHKDRDVFALIEGNRSDADGFSSKCEICGKEFYERFYFYEHAKRKHSDLFLKGSNEVCLADHCEVFRCDLHEKYPHHIPSNINCDEKKITKLQRKCENLMRSCLPENMFHFVYDQLYMAICSTLTCEKFLHPFQDSISLTTVIILSIAVPITLFMLGQICLVCYDHMDSVDDDEKYLLAQRSRYEARNAQYNERFYGMQQRGLTARYRKPFGRHSNYKSKYT